METSAIGGENDETEAGSFKKGRVTSDEGQVR
jgi:hypothetical protein